MRSRAYPSPNPNSCPGVEKEAKVKAQMMKDHAVELGKEQNNAGL